MPSEDLYCDSNDIINSISVNVTDPINGSHQYDCTLDHSKILHTDNRSYHFTFQVEHYQFWRPFNIAIAVNNSIGSSPFSDYMIVRGANNGIVIIITIKYNNYYTVATYPI